MPTTLCCEAGFPLSGGACGIRGAGAGCRDHRQTPPRVPARSSTHTQGTPRLFSCWEQGVLASQERGLRTSPLSGAWGECT